MSIKKHTPMQAIRNRFISGILVLVPMAITLFVFTVIFNVTVGLVQPLTRMIMDDRPPVLTTLVSLIVVLCIIYFAGSLASHVVGRRLIGLGERILDQIPIAATVYSSSKKVIEMLRTQVTPEGRQIALFDHPTPGLKAMGLVTGTIQTPDGTTYYKIIIPTTPNPTTGYLQFVPVDRAEILDMSAEDAFKFIMSAGILGPPVFPVRPATATPSNDALPDA